ncbi:MAG: hypothetical protein ACI88H_001141 [Cocleimonas sp.]|jgi:hypothetical protein
MSHSERIRYTVTGYNFTEISKGKGSIEYQLTDDFGNERTVTAMAKVNLFKKVSKVRPIYHRELPLIKALAQTQLNDSVIVDFSEYNKQHPRGSMRTQKISIPSVKVKNVSASQISDFSSLLDNKTRLIQLMLITLTGFITISYLISKVPSPFV